MPCVTQSYFFGLVCAAFRFREASAIAVLLGSSGARAGVITGILVDDVRFELAKVRSVVKLPDGSTKSIIRKAVRMR